MLAVHELTKSFGHIEALRGVSFSVSTGEIHGVCGENGAGKSTLMKSLMGIVHPDSGAIEIDGKVRTIEGPQRAQELGLALVAQELSLAPHLSILDNIWLGQRDVPLFHRRAKFRQRAAEALQLLGAEYDLDRPVGALTMGERQIVEIARLLVRDARLWILDEPTATLSDVEIARMMAALRALKAKGSSVLYVTHRLGEIFQICDSVTVLRNGRHVTTRAVAGLERRELIELVLGRRFEEMYPAPRSHSSKSQGLAVSNLHIPRVVDDFSIVAPRGEVTCIAGQVGAGAAAIIRSLAGLIPEATGSIALDGVALPIGSVSKRIRRNVAFVSEDRGREGLFRRSVLENLAATHFPKCRRAGLLSWRKVRRFASDVCPRVMLDGNRLDADAFDLSGGNQQKILFARAFGGEQPGVILINEPTRGVDIGARAEIYRVLREFCQMGYVLLMTSSDLEEVVGISDSVVTMYRGRAISRYERGQIDMSTILADITHPVGMAS
jgi:ribose transport system ATP-binding protein/rhamnose transport system ATP-binding protein